MADIQEAARWLCEGKEVQRQEYAGVYWLTPFEPRRTAFQVVRADGRNQTIDCSDLLAEDWEPIE